MRYREEQIEWQLNNPIIQRNSDGHAIITLVYADPYDIIVDDEDYYPLLALKNITFGGKYARISIKSRNYMLHRYVMNYEGKDLIDHINRNKLDNRKCNLRVATHSQNSYNKNSKPGSSSKYLGVFLLKNGKYRASVGLNVIGEYIHESDAAKMRDLYAIELHKEFASLNFPKEIYKDCNRFNTWKLNLIYMEKYKMNILPKKIECITSITNQIDNMEEQIAKIMEEAYGQKTQ